MDNLFEQITNISKAHAYDILSDQVIELKREIEILRSEKAQLAIMLKGEKDRVEALRAFINEVRPQNPELIPLDGDTEKEIEQEMKDYDDLKNINI